MRSEFFILANGSETQRSGATLSGTSGRQNGKGTSRRRRRMQEIVLQAEVVHAALKQRLILVAGYILAEIFAAALGVTHLAQHAAVRAGDALDGEIAGVGVETHIHRRRAGQIHILRGNLPVRRKLTNQRFRADKPTFAEICDIWAFGFDGQIQFEDGVIRAWSEAPLESGAHMTVMVALEKGVLSPVRVVEDSFEAVKERALAGSDYGAGEDAEWDDEPLTAGDLLLFAAIILTLVLLILLLVVLLVKVGKVKRKKRMERVGYFRDAPNGGDLNVTYQLGLCSGLCEEDALLGAYLMRLISQGCLESTDDSNDAEPVRLRLSHGPQSGNMYDDALYTILKAAAGADGVLDPNELEHYCGQNYVPLSRFMESCERSGKQTLVKNGCLKGAVLDHDKDLTKKGQQELDEIYGLKHFLLDFS